MSPRPLESKERPNASRSARSSPPSAPLRVAVAGLGERGLVHAALISTLERATLVALADPRASARRTAAGAGFTAPMFSRFDRLLEKTTPDAVIVCAPLALRAKLARQALRAGAAVLIEKPVTLDHAEAGKVAAVAGQAGLPLVCSHPLLRQPVFERALQAVREGTIGEVKQVRASAYVSRVFNAEAARRVSQGGGVVAHVALDLFALLIDMLGMPAEVHATGGQLYGDQDDEVHAGLVFSNGVSVGIDCSWSMPGYPRPAAVIEIDGDRGHLLVSDDALEIETAAGGHQRWTDADLPQLARFDLDGEARWREDEAFVDSVLAGAVTPDPLRAHVVMRAVESSARDRGAVVRLAGSVAA